LARGKLLGKEEGNPRWEADLTMDGKKHTLGGHDTKKMANDLKIGKNNPVERKETQRRGRIA